MLRFRPDASARLERDKAAASARARRTAVAAEKAKVAATEILGRFAGRKIQGDGAWEAANAVMGYVRDPLGVEIARFLFTGPLLHPILTKSGRRELANMGEHWLDILDSADLDFGSPLAKLFWALDDARRADGRSWFVTVAQAPLPASNTFGQDNWIFLLAFALSGGSPSFGKTFGVILRRFEPEASPIDGLPMKTMGAVSINGPTVHLASSAEVEAACRSDPHGGGVLDPELDVVYEDMSVLCPGFASTLEESRPPPPPKNLVVPFAGKFKPFAVKGADID